MHYPLYCVGVSPKVELSLLSSPHDEEWRDMLATIRRNPKKYILVIHCLIFRNKRNFSVLSEFPWTRRYPEKLTSSYLVALEVPSVCTVLSRRLRWQLKRTSSSNLVQNSFSYYEFHFLKSIFAYPNNSYRFRNSFAKLTTQIRPFDYLPPKPDPLT